MTALIVQNIQLSGISGGDTARLTLKNSAKKRRGTYLQRHYRGLDQSLQTPGPAVRERFPDPQLDISSRGFSQLKKRRPKVQKRTGSSRASAHSCQNNNNDTTTTTTQKRSPREDRRSWFKFDRVWLQVWTADKKEGGTCNGAVRPERWSPAPRHGTARLVNAKIKCAQGSH